MLFSFSSSSFHSSFPPPAPDSLLTTCETYAVWLTLQICCIHYLVIVHICFCHSLSLYIPSLCLMSLMMINLFFSVFAQFVLATSFFFFFPPLRTSNVPVALILSVPHFFPASPSSSLPSPPPSLNPVELVFPPSLPSVLQSTCDTLRSHSDSLGFTPNMLPRHPTLGNFEEFAC